MMNKKGAQGLSVGMVLAIFLFILLAMFFVGGASKVFEIIGVLKQIPAWVYVIGIVLWVVFKK